MGLDYHLERKLRLQLDKDTSLYSWSIDEIGSDNERVGLHQIPWVWTQYFTAVHWTLSDSYSVTRKHNGDDNPETIEVAQRQVIRIKLKSGDPRKKEWWTTRYSMFGTDRIIDDFQLNIVPILAGEQEECTAWGSVSYDSEIDFRTETENDVVVFYLMVSPETFGRYMGLIAHDYAHEIVLRLNSVAGFYSEWSPGISTRHIKVLTAGKAQEIKLPAGVTFDPPRLGRVHEAELYINSRRTFEPLQRDDDEEEPAPAASSKPFETPQPAGLDKATLSLISTMNGNAKWIIGLLVIIAITLLVKR